MPSRGDTLNDLLSFRAQSQPDDRAYVFLSDRGEEAGSFTFSELYDRARVLARCLARVSSAGDRVLLLFPPGLDFIVGFFGCTLAGLVPVPMMVPRRNATRDATESIIADCSPKFSLTNRELLDSPRGGIFQQYSGSGITCLMIDEIVQDPAQDDSALPGIKATDIAFMQYTSGSTSSPKGVVVSHGNLMANLEMMRQTLSTTKSSTCVSWLPLYHDMGLILNVLQTLNTGALCVLMAPGAFIQRPMTWLRAISDYRAEIAGAPNFAYDLCVERLKANVDSAEGLDLSCLALAYNAAEPVRADTIERFASAFARYRFDPKAMAPCYGMAEATLMISGTPRGTGPVMQTISRADLLHHRVTEPENPDDAQIVVASGRGLPGVQIAVVDPDRLIRLGANQIGEIWSRGPLIACGYWQQPDATERTFGAVIGGEGNDRWLRTGDLGFLNADGDLFITGRIKDVLIIRGMNHYPQDIEATAQAAHPALRRHCGAAFLIRDKNDNEKVAIVQEVERVHRGNIDAEEVAGLIREAIASEHEISIQHVVLTRPNTVPKTTSGKIQRSMTRQLWLEGQLEALP